MAQVRLAFEKVFTDSAPATLHDLEAINADFHADVVLANSLVLADSWMHERGGPVNARISTTMYGLYSKDAAPFGLAKPPNASPLGRLRNRAMNLAHRRVVFGPVNRHLDEVRQRVGLRPQSRAILDTFMSPYLWIQDTVPSFEYPRSDLPAQVHFTGPLLPEAPAGFTPPSWWPELTSGRPVVLVTQGTVRNDVDTLIGPTLEALADRDVLVIATTGSGTVAVPGTVPSNARVVSHLPYAALMPSVSAYVTNGGFGGVQMALAHGVPMVVAGATEDKPEVAARVAWTGAGIGLRGQPTAGRLRSAITQVLTEPSYRDNATRLATDIAAYDSPTRAAELLERLAATAKPVLRD